MSGTIRKSIIFCIRIILLGLPELPDLHGGNLGVFEILIVLIIRRKDGEREDRD